MSGTSGTSPGSTTEAFERIVREDEGLASLERAFAASPTVVPRSSRSSMGHSKQVFAVIGAAILLIAAGMVGFVGLSGHSSPPAPAPHHVTVGGSTGTVTVGGKTGTVTVGGTQLAPTHQTDRKTGTAPLIGPDGNTAPNPNGSLNPNPDPQPQPKSNPNPDPQAPKSGNGGSAGSPVVAGGGGSGGGSGTSPGTNNPPPTTSGGGTSTSSGPGTTGDPVVDSCVQDGSGPNGTGCSGPGDLSGGSDGGSAGAPPPGN